jgi:hypothetical protein
MIHRASVMSLMITCLMSLPLAASQPQGIAGMFLVDTNPPADFGCFPANEFAAYLAPGELQLAPTDTLTVTLAIIPFPIGPTFIELDTPDVTFAGIVFEDGVVNFADSSSGGLRYDPKGWNDVTIELHPATQDYVFVVNGARSSPSPFFGPCQGGCYSVQAYRLDGLGGSDTVPGGSVAWIDTISIFKDSPAGRLDFFDVTFDACPGEARSFQMSGGALVASNPPPRGRIKH